MLSLVIAFTLSSPGLSIATNTFDEVSAEPVTCPNVVADVKKSMLVKIFFIACQFVLAVRFVRSVKVAHNGWQICDGRDFSTNVDAEN